MKIKLQLDLRKFLLILLTLPACTGAETTSVHSTEEIITESIVQESSQEREKDITFSPSGWWTATWSNQGLSLSVDYSRGSRFLSETINVGKSYSPFGEQVEGSEVRQRDGEDFYGREQHMTIGVLSGWHGTVKPDTVVCDGTLLYPQGSEIDEGLFARRISVSVVFNYDENGKLKGGSGKEEFSGRVKTSDGVLQYQGDGTGTFIVQDGQLAWTQRTEITTYTYNDKPYAQTVTVITPESEYLGGRWVTVREVYLTETTYENGSQRQSEIQVITERNQFGTITGKSGNGTVTGTELVNGSFVDYTGHITLEYMFDSGRYGWMKASYHEQRSATLTLPEWLPFEVITIDDSDFRPIF